MLLLLKMMSAILIYTCLERTENEDLENAALINNENREFFDFF